MVRRPEHPFHHGDGCDAPEGNDVSDIFDEVSEDLRAERTRRLLQRYGLVLLGVLVLVLIGVGGYQGWQYYQSKQIAQFAGGYIAAQRTADGPPGAARQAAIPELEKLVQTGDAGYRTLARLRIAAIKADAGDLPAALALWDQVSADSAADPMLRDIARLTWAMHQIDGGDPAAVTAHLAPLTAPDNPWHSLAEEQQALLAMRQGHNDEARTIVQRLAQDVTAPDGVRGRANGLLTRLGGQAGG